MTIALWVIGIHILEILIILGVLTAIKNRKLEKYVSDQNEFINALQIVINDSKTKLDEIDQRGIFKSDDEIGWFFEQIKSIQETLNQFGK